MIPRILHRVVPEVVPEEYERYWSTAQELHPGWEFRTWQDPIDPEEFESAHLWPRVESGAQLAGLVRLEVLWKYGGVYLDMDVEPIRSLEPLLQASAFACWEDRRVVPDAVLAFEAGHPAVRECLDRALAMDPSEGAWATGPGVSTDVLKRRTDVLLLPPACFYPYYYTEPERADENFGTIPWVYGVHRWHGSWRTSRKRLTVRRALRAGRRALRRLVVGRSAAWRRADELRELTRDPLAAHVRIEGSVSDGLLAERWASSAAEVVPASLDVVIVGVDDVEIDQSALGSLLAAVRPALHVGGSVAVLARAPRSDARALRSRASDLAQGLDIAGFREIQPARATAIGDPMPAGDDHRLVAVAAIR